MSLGDLIGEKIDEFPHRQRPFYGNEFQSDNYRDHRNHSSDSKELGIHYPLFLGFWCIQLDKRSKEQVILVDTKSSNDPSQRDSVINDQKAG